jgi:hypothetical protein
MRTRLAFIVSMFLVACAPSLENGYYAVTEEVVLDTCGNTPAGTTDTINWSISNDDPDYTLSDNDSNSLEGTLEGDQIVFPIAESGTVDGCATAVRGAITLDPTGDAFTGTSKAHFASCTLRCDIHLKLRGKKQ